MGGSGSGRWGWHNTKATVESCTRFTVGQVLRGPAWGMLSWTRGGEPSGSISYQVHYGNEGPQRLQLIYSITYHDSRPKVDIDYSIPFVSTPTPWGSPRYWLLCPDCGRRCRTLYHPPSGQRYTCRLCGNLTYTSSQESHKSNYLAKLMGPDYPGFTPDELESLLQWRLSGELKPPKKLWPKLGAWYAERLQAEQQAQHAENERYLAELANLPGPYDSYLTPAAICERSGLSLADLAALNDSRLLIHDHGGRYRPKLAGWAGKLAYLLRAGWSLAELKAWARGRWSTPDPRRWPPSLADWR